VDASPLLEAHTEERDQFAGQQHRCPLGYPAQDGQAASHLIEDRLIQGQDVGRKRRQPTDRSLLFPLLDQATHQPHEDPTDLFKEPLDRPSSRLIQPLVDR